MTKTPPAKRQRGRPGKLEVDPAIQAKIVQAVRGGNYRVVAAEWAGVSAETLSRWMDRGEKEAGTVYSVFRQAVLEAEKEAEIRAVALIQKAAVKDPKAAQWWLERKFHERWGRKDRHEHTGAGGGALEIRVVDVLAQPDPREDEDG